MFLWRQHFSLNILKCRLRIRIIAMPQRVSAANSVGLSPTGPAARNALPGPHEHRCRFVEHVLAQGSTQVNGNHEIGLNMPLNCKSNRKGTKTQ